MLLTPCVAIWGCSGIKAASPSSAPAIRATARGNLKMLAVSMQIYLSDWDGVFPPAATPRQVEAALEPYAKNREVWRDPNAGKILFNAALSGATMKDVRSPSSTLALYKSVPLPKGRRWVAFADGDVRCLEPDEWTKIEPALHRPPSRR